MIAEIKDADVLARVNQIISSRLPSREKYEALDKLWFDVTNHHPLSFAADVLEVVSSAQTQVLREGGETNR